MVVQTNIGGNNLVFVAGIIHKFTQIIKQLQLGISLAEFGLVLRALRQRLGSIRLQAGHGITLLIALQRILRRAQLCIDFLQTTVDELLGLQGYLVLVGIGLTVVANGQLIEEVQASAGILVL